MLRFGSIGAVALASTTAAHAAPPAMGSVLRPVIAPVGVVDQYQQWRYTRGIDPGPIACGPVLERSALLCFRQFEGDKRRWVTGLDLQTWDVTYAELVVAAEEAAPQIVAKAPLHPIEGSERPLLQPPVAEAWGAAVYLAPKAAAARLGGEPVRLGVPGLDLVVAWQGDGGDVDEMAAVEVAEQFAAHPVPILPTAWTWRGGAWRPWATAVKSAEDAPAR